LLNMMIISYTFIIVIRIFELQNTSARVQQGIVAQPIARKH